MGKENESNNSGVKKRSVLPQIVILGVIIVAAVTVIKSTDIGSKLSNIFADKIVGKEGEVTTITESTIEEVLEISELQTADYIYNAVVKVRDDKDNILYYIAYEGTVTAGINFDDINIELNDETKEITLSVPKATVQDCIVDVGSLEYIFVDDNYNNENELKTAYAYCEDDLNSRMENEDELLTNATNNAKQVVEALVSPWVNQIDSDYTITIQ
jgi:predicted nucleic acid-binding protein